MTEVRERKEMDPSRMWDLTQMYRDDENWEEALKQIDELTQTAASFQSKLKDADSIRKALDADMELSRQINNVFTYAMLRQSEDTRDAKAQSMYTRAYGKMVMAMSATAYITPEILSLSEAQLESLCSDPLLEDYRFMIEDLIRTKPHTLNAREEQIVASLQEALAAPQMISESLMDADLTFDTAMDSEGNPHEVSNSTFILLQTSHDRVLRENAFRSYYKGYRSHINTLAASYAGAVKAAAAEAAIRSYPSSREMAMSADNIPVSVYDNLIASVHDHMDTMYRYAALRKRLLKVDELHYYDLYVPLVKGIDRKYTYEDAQEMVLSAVSVLGEEYVSTVRKAFASRWIDVYPNKGKRSGAYSSGSYDSAPYILTNFTGTLDSVSTIAHEMGHSMHSYRTNHTQPVQYADYTLFVAEVASTVNENLLIEQLLQKETDPLAELALLNQYLEGFKGTVYRQTMFAEFEKEAHAMAERGESLDPQALNAVYERLIRLYFGDDLVVDEEVTVEWARIPHFYRPFYVYVYATGYSTAVALSEKILAEGEPAVKRYLEFLSMGSSRYPLDELKHAGVDLTTPEPVDTALEKFAEVLKRAEKIADDLGL